jgi:hypothetical protein
MTVSLYSDFKMVLGGNVDSVVRGVVLKVFAVRTLGICWLEEVERELLLEYWQ